jgi:acyl-CoA thioester hydrolase
MYTSTTQIRVRYGETDQMGYLYYGFYALYYEQGRTESIRQLGYTYKELEAAGIMMPVVEMNAKYYRPALYDDLITVKTIVKTLDESSEQIQFHAELYNESGKLLNEGLVTLVFYDMQLKRKVPLPKILGDKLRPFFGKAD